MAVNETLCTGCMHVQVCSFKQTFLEAQKAIDNLVMPTPLTDKHEQRIIDISWLSTKLHCAFYNREYKTQKRWGEYVKER